MTKIQEGLMAQILDGYLLWILLLFKAIWQNAVTKNEFDFFPAVSLSYRYCKSG